MCMCMCMCIHMRVYFGINLPGHSTILQVCNSCESPTQFEPPNAGVGSVQLRDLDFSPSPQVFEQVSHELYSDHPPLTKYSNN